MPIVTGVITHDGAVVDVIIGVSGDREKVLRRVGFAVPQPVALRALIDTGSHVTGFHPKVFQSLELPPLGKILVRTPSTKPGDPWEADQYKVSLALVSGVNRYPMLSVYAVASEDFLPREEIQGLLGRDVLKHCILNYFGPSGRFELAF